jgi:hypothetical protein
MRWAEEWVGLRNGGTHYSYVITKAVLRTDSSAGVDLMLQDNAVKTTLNFLGYL